MTGEARRTVYPQCVDWIYHHACNECGAFLKSGTEHVQVIEHEEHGSHLPHEMPVTRYCPGCEPAPQTYLEIMGGGVLE